MDYLNDAENDIKTYFEIHKIPNYFYHCLFGELIKIMGAGFLIPDTGYFNEYDDDGNVVVSNENNYSYKEQIGFYLSMYTGTAGWHMAFTEACTQCHLLDVLKDYSKMCWVRSDMFDGHIVDEMLDILFDKEQKSEYYFYKVKRGKLNEVS